MVQFHAGTMLLVRHTISHGWLITAISLYGSYIARLKAVAKYVLGVPCELQESVYSTAGNHKMIQVFVTGVFELLRMHSIVLLLSCHAITFRHTVAQCGGRSIPTAFIAAAVSLMWPTTQQGPGQPAGSKPPGQLL